MNHISFKSKKNNDVINIPTENCRKKIIRKRFGKGPTIFYNEITGTHKSGDIYTKLQTKNPGTLEWEYN